MVTTSRRAGRVTNKTKLLIYRGSDKVDLALAEVIVWENQHDGNSSSSDGSAQPHHVGAIGVESNELLEHHLQAALSSASLFHSRAAAKPSSPTPASRQKPDTTTGTSDASLNYHIPTPDATGLVGSADFTALYQQVKYHEPVNYVRYSETVEESCSGAGGLGYCMDEDDEKWLTEFNAKAEGGSGTEHATSPLRESTTPNQSVTAGRERRIKGKDKEKDKERETPLTTLSISEDTFEYVMGMMEKYAEDAIPMLHTDLAQMPQFPALEHLFSSPVPASFYPAYEVPKGLPDSKILTRMARNIYHHWRQRREIRKGKSIFPSLNYDEANDGDPYVCFRRRDIRATRKTRRTDNYSVEKFQKLQYELQTAHQIVSMVQGRERLKQSAFRSDKELWEAKWKFYETKRKWPSLGISREEEEIITGRSLQQQQARAAESAAAMNGAHILNQQNANIVRKKQPDRERDERERRERAIEMARAAEKGFAAVGRSMAPEHYKERLQALRQKLEDAMSRRTAANAEWDDFTDSSYQPLPRPAAEKNFKTSEYLLPNSPANRDTEGIYRPAAFRLRRGRGGLLRLDRRTALIAHQRGKQPSSFDGYADWLFPDSSADMGYSDRPTSIDGFNLADYAVDPDVQDVEVVTGTEQRDKDDRLESGEGERGDDSVENVNDIVVDKSDSQTDSNATKAEGTDTVAPVDKSDLTTKDRIVNADVDMTDDSEIRRVDFDAERQYKRRRLNEMRRYDVDSGGAVGVGMGIAKDDDRVVIDDLDLKYIRHRVSLLHSEDLEKLCPDMSIIAQTNAILDTPVELPPLPQFVRPEPPMAMPLAQQQLLQQQHVERFQAAASQYAQQQAYNQQLAAAQANHQLQQQQHQQQQHHPMQPPQLQQGQNRAPSDTSNGHASPAVNQQGQGMLPPQSTGQNGRPPIIKRPSSQNGNAPGLPNVAIAQGQGRPSVSPTFNMQQGQQMNGSPQHANGLMLPNGKPVIGPNGQMDPNMQRMLAARLHQQQQLQQQQQMQDGSNPNPLGNANVNANASTNQGLAALAQMSPEQQQQMAQLAAKAGYGENIVAFLASRKPKKQQSQAQVQQLQGQGQGQPNQTQPSAASANGSSNGNSNSNGNGNGNGSATPAPDPNFASPQLPSGSLNLKLPAHATKRLGNNQTPNSPAQRAS